MQTNRSCVWSLLSSFDVWFETIWDVLRTVVRSAEVVSRNMSTPLAIISLLTRTYVLIFALMFASLHF
mgnify:CR=1 FL=1